MIRPAAAEVFSATFAKLRTVDSSCAWVAPNLALSLATESNAVSITSIAADALSLDVVVPSYIFAALSAVAAAPPSPACYTILSFDFSFRSTRRGEA